MLLSEIQNYFDSGYLKNYEVIPEVMGNGWNICFICSNNDEKLMLIEQRERKPRAFVKIESALGAIEKVGFKISGLKGL